MSIIHFKFKIINQIKQKQKDDLIQFFHSMTLSRIYICVYLYSSFNKLFNEIRVFSELPLTENKNLNTFNTFSIQFK